MPMDPALSPLLLYRCYVELVVILLKCFPVRYLFALFFFHLSKKLLLYPHDSCPVQSPLSSFPNPAPTPPHHRVRRSLSSSMSHWPQWWLLHLNIITPLLVYELFEGRSGVLIIFLLPDDMASRWYSISVCWRHKCIELVGEHSIIMCVK